MVVASRARENTFQVFLDMWSLSHESSWWAVTDGFVLCLKVLCVNLLDTAVENITAGVREHQQVHEADASVL